MEIKTTSIERTFRNHSAITKYKGKIIMLFFGNIWEENIEGASPYLSSSSLLIFWMEINCRMNMFIGLAVCLWL